LKELISQPWFFGYLSSKEAETLLCNHIPGTFLVRLSKAAPGAFAIAFVYSVGTIIHILVQSRQPDGFSILDQETNSERKFESIQAIVAAYKDALLYPLISSIPLQP
jgi:hypothetical protein